MEEPFYTTGIWDMVDNFNQRSGFGYTIYNYPEDRISGIPMSHLEDALIGATRWNTYRNNIIGIAGNSTGITELFRNWE